MRSSLWLFASATSTCVYAITLEMCPADGFYPGITASSAAVTANPVTNVSVSNRYLSTGGGSYASPLEPCLFPEKSFMARSQEPTDGGPECTMDWQSIYMFSYQAIHELSVVGKAFTKEFFNMTDTTKLYSYYQGCSEGGREGWSQVQRFGDEWDGAVIGAPAFRYAFHRFSTCTQGSSNRLWDTLLQPCELEKIVNETNHSLVDDNDIDVLIGESYYCAATTGITGTVSAEGVADSDGNQVYFSYRPSAAFDDAETEWMNETSQSWEVTPSSLGGETVAVLLQLQNITNIPTLDGATYDTLRDWIWQFWNRYSDSLMTTLPDLTPFMSSSGKVLHYHSESDYSIPRTSSVHYYESVRSVMYPGLSYNDSVDAMNDWYRLFLVPGAGHCAPNNGVEPVTLNATVLQGDDIGMVQQICSWPLRPLWTSNGTVMECVYDQKSIDNWQYDLNAFPLPVY
ncbi:tannase and feruloyl esterase [Gymnopus androsaceus JB14]|uniref:Carboxylic ester hydrolase n=1 Tax=Gymnopus androsaceus JB14 TaxID=1447944 RepID=A0A6A4HSM5_9AGAR|nr:tannase and feruloyl esterase [Gymnopus androsaceus JB14]